MADNRPRNKRTFAEIGVSLDEEHAAAAAAAAAHHGEGGSRKMAKLASAEEDDDLMEDIMDLVDSAEGFASLDTGRLTALVSTLDKAILKNQQMRVKYGDEPKRFMASEEAVDEAIKGMHELAAAPSLYAKFVTLGGCELFETLLAHENTDIVLDVINLLQELTDPATMVEFEEAVDLVVKLMDLKIFNLLVINLPRLSEEEEEDAKGIYNTLSILENLVEIEPDYCTQICKSTKILRYLISLIRKNTLNDNTYYCAELLATFLNIDNSLATNASQLNVFSAIVATLKFFARKPPSNKDQHEYCENLFSTLRVLFIDNEIKGKFSETDLLPTLIKMIRERKMKLRHGALKVVSYALTGNTKNCQSFVAENGLRILFSLFMRKEKRAKQKYLVEEEDLEEHVISIILQLFIHLSDVDYARLLRKFQESEYEKIDRLIELHDKYLSRLEQAEKTLVAQPDDDDDKEELYNQRLEKGLFHLQQTDLVIGLICSAGDKKMKERVFQVLHQQDTDINDVRKTLKEFQEHLGEDESGVSMSKIIPAVLDFLEE